MKKLKTKVEVSRIAEGKVAIIDQIVVGDLSINKEINSEGIKVGFKYSKVDGTTLESKGKVYTWSQINQLWLAVKEDAPNTGFDEYLDYCFLQAFKIEMALTFDITVDQIEEVI